MADFDNIFRRADKLPKTAQTEPGILVDAVYSKLNQNSATLLNNKLKDKSIVKGNSIELADKNFWQEANFGLRLPAREAVSQATSCYDSVCDRSLLNGRRMSEPSMLIKNSTGQLKELIARQNKGIENLSFGAETDQRKLLLETDLNSYLGRCREIVLGALINETLQNAMEDAERVHWRQMISDWEEQKRALFQGIPPINVTQMVPSPNTRPTETSDRHRTKMTATELAFAKKVRIYVKGCIEQSSSLDMPELFSSDILESRFKDIWKQVSAVLAIPLINDVPLDIQRVSTEWAINLIEHSTSYLQSQFVAHVESVVNCHLDVARRGGSPGVAGLVQAYLNVRFPTPYSGYEDGFVNDRHPIWAFVYYCLRCGDVVAAREACEKARLPHVATALYQIESDAVLLSDTVSKLLLDCGQDFRTSSDPFKRAVYSLLGIGDQKLDHPEVADKIEDWLWMRLKMAKLFYKKGGRAEDDDRSENSSLKALQQQIALDYGEEYFSTGQSPLMYWTALWLTGQLEKAIDYMSRQGDQMRTHAVHIAIVADRRHALLTADNVKAKLLSSDETDEKRGLARLNLGRLLMLYTDKLEKADMDVAVNYLYLLHRFKTTNNESLFELGLWRMISLNKDCSDWLIGYMDEKGQRVPGLIDRFPLNTQDIIGRLALRAETNADIDAAIRLHHLANNDCDTVRLLNSRLSQVISQPCAVGSQREKLCRHALSLAKQYKTKGCKAQIQQMSTFYLLLDLATFFKLYHSKRYDDCLNVLATLDWLPLQPESVERKVKAFHMIPEEVRRTLSDILIAVMTLSVDQFKDLKQTVRVNPLEQQRVNDIRKRSKALLIYAGMIPYRFPNDITAHLVQLEAYLN